MKKQLLFVGGLLFSGCYLLAQQTPVSQTPQNKNALLEELTGINCQWCPDGHKRANEIAAANPGRVVLVNIHAGGFAAPGGGQPDLRTTAGTALDNFFNPTGYPAGTVQRTPHSSDNARLATGRGNWQGQVNTALSQVSPVNIAMNAEIDASTRELVLNVEMFYTTPQASGTNHYLNIGILQNNYEGPQVGSSLYPAAVLSNGSYLHQHMFRGFINEGGTWGEQIDASQTGVITKTVTYTLPAAINNIPLSIGNLEFYAFLHEGNNGVSNSKVLTAALIEPTYTNVPGPTANAVSITNTITVCEGSPFSPIIKVSNGGSEITAIEFSSAINGGTAVPYSWTGSIPQFGSQEITIPSLILNSAQQSNNVVVTITSVNGGSGTVGSTASATRPITVAENTATSSVGVVKITTDRYGDETTWRLLNSAGTIVVQGGPYTVAGANGSYPQPDVNFTVVPDECYKLIVYDAYGDGFDSGYGNGNIEVYSGGTVVAGVTHFPSGSEKQDAFKSAINLSVNKIGDAIALTIYPNPASDKVNVSFEATGSFIVEITDLQGRTVLSESFNNLSGNQSVELNTSDLKTGNYLISVSQEGASFTKMISIR